MIESAFERGYFDQSGGVTVEELAGEFDVSESEARERLARGLATLLKVHRADTDDPDAEGLLADADCCHSPSVRVDAIVQAARK